jgi:WD40 repeat protein
MEVFDFKKLHTIRYNHTITTPCLQIGVWYLPKHQAWLTAGKDNLLRQWFIQKAEDSYHESSQIIFEIGGHTDQIMAVTEINVPFCIATASLDKTIRFYNL